MKTPVYQYLFGPVPSRRLGYSLGVDVVPFKTCSFDCVYCQLGQTTHQTMRREMFVPVEDVVREIEKKVQEPGRIDYITLSGSGEPTLYAGLAELIPRVKEITDIPVAVLTNSSLLSWPSVRHALLPVDLMVPSLDACDEDRFRAVNRPLDDMDIESFLQGLLDFQADYSHTMWLEIFFLAGMNDTPESVKRLADFCQRLKPDKIQLNTVTRPPGELTARAVSPRHLETLAGYFGQPTEIIADFNAVHQDEAFRSNRDDILSLLRRRPCSIADIANGLSMHKNEIVKYLEDCEARDLVDVNRRNGVSYYRIQRGNAAS